ncbi:MAG: hypothetical protein GX657_06285 [Chloroflexi bacterium]|nr:hypothetical protein [Chloroflexota bacterium]
MMLIMGVGVAAVYYGMKDRTAAIQTAAQLHYDRGVAHLAQQELELAVAELELALQLNPEHPGALTSLDEARQALVSQPSPTPVIRQELTGDYYADLVAAHEAGDCASVVDLADRLWGLAPDYRRSEVEEMLFDCFYRNGLQLVEEGRIEEAIRLFDRALQLRPGRAEVEQQRALASLYMEGMIFWGADWDKVLRSLSELRDVAPDYRDVSERVFQAAVNYADLFAKQGDWCVAVVQYDRALSVHGSSEVAARREESAELCLANPSPTPEGTPGPEGWPTPSGDFSGRVVEQTPIGPDKIYVRGRVLDKNDHGVGGVIVKIQAWDWSVTHVTDGNGVFAFDGLDQPVTYTVTLENYASAPVEAPCEWGKITWVEFRENG